MRIVRTKILPPPLQPKLVERGRLNDMLDEGLRSRARTEFARAVTLVCAPAGYGKTTCVRLWTESLSEPVAWYTADSWDNDVARFWLHLVHAVRSIRPEFGSRTAAMFESAAMVGGGGAVQPAETFAEELAELDPIVLVIDEYHEITLDEVHAQFARLVEILPPNAHIVISTRHEPPWYSVRLSARGTLLRVTHDELRFTEREFLLREVVDSQAPELREFLGETSLLPYLTPRLCDAVTRRDDGAETLKRLEREGLFVHRLAGEPPAYRYHGAFARALSDLLPRESAELVVRHQTVACALHGEDEIGGAIEHAFAAADPRLALEFIAADPRRVWEQEGPARTARWIAAIPNESLASAPLVAAYRAALALVLGKLRELPALLEEIEGMIDADDDEAAHGLLALVRAYLALFSGALSGVRPQLAAAVEKLPADDTLLRAMAELGRGDLAAMEGSVSESASAFGEALALGRRGNHAFAVLHAGFKLANLHWQCGRLTEALIVCDELDRYVVEHRLSRTPRVGPLIAVRAAVLRERGELAHAADLARAAVETCSDERLIAAWCLCVEAMVRFSLRDVVGALESITSAEAIRRDSGLPDPLTKIVGAWKARVYVALGDVENARACLDAVGISVKDTPGIFSEEAWLVHARVLLLEGRTREAISVIDRVEDLARVGNRKPVLIESNIVRVRLGTDAALEALERAVEIASSERVSQRFLDERTAADATDPVVPLLKRLAPGRPWARFATELMRESSGHAGGETSDQPLLSDRERDVVLLMAQGKSNQEIADTLFLSVGTVKWHTTNIFSKLMVSRRTEAVARARELGFLPDEKT